MMLEQGELLTEQQTADFLGLAPLTLCNWRSQRRGPAAVKIGRKSFYRRETIMKWIASREGAYSSEPAASRKHTRGKIAQAGQK
ncbi:MAG: helix-turn-helix domain-containing protein [Pseudomonadota bacterium]